jgi:hypothetical protein
MAIEFEGVKWLATLGVGGVLAGGMFLFYRKDSNDKHKRVEDVAKDNGELTKLCIGVIEKNGEAYVKVAESHAKLAAAVEQMTDLLWRMKNGG